MRGHIPGSGETLMLKLRHYTRDKPRIRSLGTQRGSGWCMRASVIEYIPEARECHRQCGTLGYTQKILFPPVSHQRRYGSLVATFILITSRRGCSLFLGFSVALLFQRLTPNTSGLTRRFKRSWNQRREYITSQFESNYKLRTFYTAHWQEKILLLNWFEPKWGNIELFIR